MLASYQNKYYQCCKREDCIILFTANEEDGFRTIYNPDRSKILRREKIVSFDEVEGLFEIRFQCKWKNRWFDIEIDRAKQSGNIIIWDNVETRRRLYNHIDSFVNRHNFSVFVSNGNSPRAWNKKLSLEDFTGFRVILNWYIPEEKENSIKLSQNQVVNLYQKLIIDTDYRNV